MFHYWDRDTVRDRLRLALHQSYRIIPTTPSGRIRSDSVLLLLSRSHVGADEPVRGLPCDLMTPDEAAARFNVTVRELRRWAHRIRRPLPHFRINRSTTRFSAEEIDRWLAENSKAKGAL